MRLTVEQRLRALERDTAVLHDTVKMLHRLIKNQRELISEYIVRRVSLSKEDGQAGEANDRPEDELYTFVCRQRFDRIEKDLKKTLQLVENLRFGLKAG
jgi:hypothetical protein